MTQRHIPVSETVVALKKRKSGTSLRGLVRELGLPEKWTPALSEVLRGVPGAMSVERENVLRQVLGLPPLGPRTRHPRTSIEVDLDTYAMLAGCKLPGETWPACLRRLATCRC